MIKTLTFAALHMTVAFSVVYLMTGSVALGGAVAFIEPLCNTVAYFFHEKLWEAARRRHEAKPRPRPDHMILPRSAARLRSALRYSLPSPSG